MRAILTYHSLDESTSPISLSPAVFAEQVRWFASGAVRIVPLGRISETSADEPTIAITFDDGFANLKAPLASLADHGLPATIFVVTGQIGATNAWGGRAEPGIPTLPLLTWRDLGQLIERGFEIGAHTNRHSRLPELSEPQVRAELDEPLATIERELGRRPISFAYPYGAYNGTVGAMVGERYQWGCSTELRGFGTVEDRRFLPRLDMYYWRRSGAIERFGEIGFRAQVWGRRQARRFRESLTSRGR